MRKQNYLEYVNEKKTKNKTKTKRKKKQIKKTWRLLKHLSK